MPELKILDDATGFLDDVPQGQIDEGELETIARMPAGMASGKSAISLRVKLPNGRTVLVQVSLRLFMGAAHYFNAAAVKEGERDLVIATADLAAGTAEVHYGEMPDPAAPPKSQAH